MCVRTRGPPHLHHFPCLVRETDGLLPLQLSVHVCATSRKPPEHLPGSEARRGQDALNLRSGPNFLQIISSVLFFPTQQQGWILSPCNNQCWGPPGCSCPSELQHTQGHTQHWTLTNPGSKVSLHSLTWIKHLLFYLLPHSHFPSIPPKEKKKTNLKFSNLSMPILQALWMQWPLCRRLRPFASRDVGCSIPVGFKAGTITRLL